MTAQDPELSAALGWPGGISDPVLDRKVLLQMVAALRLASQQALEALRAMNPYPASKEDQRASALAALLAALAQQAEPTRSQQMVAAGFKPRDRRLECDECGGKFTAQMLPIHKCAQQAEPVAGKVVAWGVFANIDGEWQLQHPVFAGDEQGKVNAEFERASYSGPQPLEVRPLGVVTATAQQAEPAQDQRCRAEPRSDGDFVCDCKIGECPGRSAEPAQEPVAYIHRQGNHWEVSERHLDSDEKSRG